MIDFFFGIYVRTIWRLLFPNQAATLQLFRPGRVIEQTNKVLDYEPTNWLYRRGFLDLVGGRKQTEDGNVWEFFYSAEFGGKWCDCGFRRSDGDLDLYPTGLRASEKGLNYREKLMGSGN